MIAQMTRAFATPAPKNMPGEIDHADPRVADGVPTGKPLACAALYRRLANSTRQPATVLLRNMQRRLLTTLGQSF
jgi:hypothetical protein